MQSGNQRKKWIDDTQTLCSPSTQNLSMKLWTVQSSYVQFSVCHKTSLHGYIIIAGPAKYEVKPCWLYCTKSGGHLRLCKQVCQCWCLCSSTNEILLECLSICTANGTSGRTGTIQAHQCTRILLRPSIATCVPVLLMYTFCQKQAVYVTQSLTSLPNTSSGWLGGRRPRQLWDRPKSKRQHSG